MITYIGLLNFTDKGLQSLKDTTKRAAAAKETAKKLGVNLRDMADNPPVGWPLERRREYFDWARQVVDGLPPVHSRLRAIFDAAYAKRP